MAARVVGLVRIEELPIQNHYHEGRMFSSVKVSSQRSDAASKTDYLRLYFEVSAFDKEIFKPGNYISYEGDLVKSKITESLSDIAVSLDEVKLILPDVLQKMKDKVGYIQTGSLLTMSGTIIKINDPTVSNDITSISILVMSENEEGKRVIAKLTGVGKIAEVIKTIEKDEMVNIHAKVYSYQIKNRLDLANYYLHDSRITSIHLVRETEST